MKTSYLLISIYLVLHLPSQIRGRCGGHDRILLDLQLSVQSVPITINVVSLNPVHGEVYLIQHYVLKFVSNLWQVGGFLRVLQFPTLIKLTVKI